VKARGAPPGGNGPRLDRVVHEPTRLRVLVHLASSPGGEAGFVALREALGLTAGNLSVQLRTLAEAGLVSLDKGYRDNRPATTVRLTVTGERALETYLDEMDGMIRALRIAPARRRNDG
jgi:DNA-binding MarR family transcriptional regulator